MDGAEWVLRTVSRATGFLLRSGYAPSPRWKCWCSSCSVSLGSLVAGAGCVTVTAVASSSRDVRVRAFAAGASACSAGRGDGFRACCFAAIREMREATAFAISMFKSGG
eukprot:6200605-Pleurochrysis_carterae.AAC.3